MSGSARTELKVIVVIAVIWAVAGFGGESLRGHLSARNAEKCTEKNQFGCSWEKLQRLIISGTVVLR